MAYYKIINGIKYDRKLIELAEELTEGRGDGRLSFQDVQQLHEATLDGRGATTIELWTLDYILSEFNVTDKARNWLADKINIVQPGTVPSLINQIVRDKYNMTALTVLVTPADVTEQSALPGNAISFEQALDKTIISFLSDHSHPASPGAVVANTFGLHSNEVANAHVQVSFKLSDLFKNAELRLLPNQAWETGNTYDFIPPAQEEAVSENWIFSLSLFDLPDHVFWSVIPRDGEGNGYNYGG